MLSLDHQRVERWKCSLFRCRFLKRDGWSDVQREVALERVPNNVLASKENELCSAMNDLRRLLKRRRAAVCETHAPWAVFFFMGVSTQIMQRGATAASHHVHANRAAWSNCGITRLMAATSDGQGGMEACMKAPHRGEHGQTQRPWWLRFRFGDTVNRGASSESWSMK